MYQGFPSLLHSIQVCRSEHVIQIKAVWKGMPFLGHCTTQEDPYPLPARIQKSKMQARGRRRPYRCSTGRCFSMGNLPSSFSRHDFGSTTAHVIHSPPHGLQLSLVWGRAAQVRALCPIYLRSGSTPMGSHVGVGEFTTHFRTYFSGWIG